MATDSAITAALAAAQTLDIRPADLVVMLRRAIAGGLTDDGRVVVATSTRGTSISFGSLAEAVAALERLQALAAADAGIVSMPGGFVCG
jgi:hypothetical protein